MAQRTLFNVIWQPGGEGRLGENGYYMYESLQMYEHLKLSQHC